MLQNKIFEPVGYLVAFVTFLFSLFLFYRDTATFWGSFAAALLAAGLIWMTYVILRIILLTIRKGRQ